MDAIKGFKSEDIYTAIPKGIIPKEPYSSFLVPDRRSKDKPLQGVRVGIVREFMVKHTKNDVAISDQIDKEIKSVLRDKLGATLVESVDPMYPDDPTVPNMTYTFQDAMAEILPHTMPEYFWRKTSTGELAVCRSRMGCPEHELCRRLVAAQGAFIGQDQSAHHHRWAIESRQSAARESVSE